MGLLGFHAQIRGEVGFDLRVGFTGNISRMQTNLELRVGHLDKRTETGFVKIIMV